MPKSTWAYMFESRICGLAGTLSKQLTGGNKTFVIVFDDEGSARSMLFEHDKPTWGELVAELQAADVPHLLYDPFDPPEHTFVGWHKVPRAAMERLIGGAFEPPDLLPMPQAREEAETLDDYPDTWGAMF